MVKLFVVAIALFHASLVSALSVSLSLGGLLGRGQCTAYTPWGQLNGIETPAGACRFAVKYATAGRWEVSKPASSIQTDATALPPSCPQSNSYLGSLAQSENCLYGVVYVPKGLRPIGGLPVYVWLHGGSFTYGSASQAGLDGSVLAIKGSMIVVVLQYRLGVLGLLPPAGIDDSNLAVQDVIHGLQTVKKGISTLGGDAKRVTVGGQSSGGTMIRALLASPKAKGLFRSVIIQSDPMNYGFAKKSTTDALRDYYYASPPLNGCKDIQCLRALPVNDILNAQADLMNVAPGIADGVPLSLPLRPTFDTSTVTVDTVSAASNNPSSLSSRPSKIPLLLSTTANEAGTLVQSLLGSPQVLSNTTYSYLLSSLTGAERAQQILASGAYALPVGNGPDNNGDDFRKIVEKVGTDLAWRCASREFARAWAGAGGRVWVAQWAKGVNYLSNVGGYCQGKVCHEDDIYPSFGTSPDPDSSIVNLQDEVIARWSAFVYNSEPSSSISRRDSWWSVQWWNPFKHVKKSQTRSNWNTYRSDADVFALGGGQVTQCPPNLWGRDVKWDWQLYG